MGCRSSGLELQPVAIDVHEISVVEKAVRFPHVYRVERDKLLAEPVTIRWPSFNRNRLRQARIVGPVHIYSTVWDLTGNEQKTPVAIAGRKIGKSELGPSNGALDELGVKNIQDGSSDVWRIFPHAPFDRRILLPPLPPSIPLSSRPSDLCVAPFRLCQTSLFFPPTVVDSSSRSSVSFSRPWRLLHVRTSTYAHTQCLKCAFKENIQVSTNSLASSHYYAIRETDKNKCARNITTCSRLLARQNTSCASVLLYRPEAQSLSRHLLDGPRLFQIRLHRGSYLRISTNNESKESSLFCHWLQFIFGAALQALREMKTSSASDVQWALTLPKKLILMWTNQSGKSITLPWH